jgi:hypothetical protein
MANTMHVPFYFQLGEHDIAHGRHDHAVVTEDPHWGSSVLAKYLCTRGLV